MSYDNLRSMALRLACARMGGAQAHALHSVRLMSVHNSKKLAQMRGSPTYIVDPFVPPPRANKPGLLSLDYWRNLQRTASSTVRSGLVRGRIQRAVRRRRPGRARVRLRRAAARLAPGG